MSSAQRSWRRFWICPVCTRINVYLWTQRRTAFANNGFSNCSRAHTVISQIWQPCSVSFQACHSFVLRCYKNMTDSWFVSLVGLTAGTRYYSRSEYPQFFFFSSIFISDNKLNKWEAFLAFYWVKQVMSSLHIKSGQVNFCLYGTKSQQKVSDFSFSWRAGLEHTELLDPMQPLTRKNCLLTGTYHR